MKKLLIIGLLSISSTGFTADNNSQISLSKKEVKVKIVNALHAKDNAGELRLSSAQDVIKMVLKENGYAPLVDSEGDGGGGAVVVDKEGLVVDVGDETHQVAFCPQNFAKYDRRNCFVLKEDTFTKVTISVE